MAVFLRESSHTSPICSYILAQFYINHDVVPAMQALIVYQHSWDDWVPQDRLRKFTEENKELAANLKKEMETLNRAQTQKSTSQKKKKATGSDAAAGSVRGSEERHSSVAALSGPRGQKRAREIEIEKVRHLCLQKISHCRPAPFSQYCKAHSTLPAFARLFAHA